MEKNTKEIEVMIGGQVCPVLITRKRIKKMYLRVDDTGRIKVNCGSWVSEADIKSFVYENEAWILNTRMEQTYRHEVNEEGVDGPFIYWWGERKYVRYEQGPKNELFLDGDIIIFSLKEETDALIQKTFRKYAEQEVMKEIEDLRWEWDARICLENGLPFPTIQVKYLKGKWGVCYMEKNLITISGRLIHYPKEGLESVLLHEYTHLLVPNHSPKFHQLMKKHMPDYKEKERVLK